MTNKTQTTKPVVQAAVQPVESAAQPSYALGETFVHNGRSVQVVELQAQGVYHVKATDAPFDSYWVNTEESTDITDITNAE